LLSWPHVLVSLRLLHLLQQLLLWDGVGKEI
jgi:hypothetical protein